MPTQADSPRSLVTRHYSPSPSSLEGTGVGQVDGAKPVDSQLEEMIDASVEYSGADKAIPHVETFSKEPTNETGEGEELPTLSIPPTLADANGDHQPMDEVPPTSVPPTQHVEESPGGPGPDIQCGVDGSGNIM